MRISKKKDDPQRSWRFLGVSLVLSRKKKKKKRGKMNLILCHLASSTFVQRRVSARPSLPAFGPKISTWSGGVGGGRRSGRRKR